MVRFHLAPVRVWSLVNVWFPEKPLQPHQETGSAVRKRQREAGQREKPLEHEWK